MANKQQNRQTMTIMQAGEYIQWLQTVPVEERNAVADALEKVDLNTPKDLVKLSRVMLLEIIRGKITPNVANSACKWAELMLSAMTVDAAASGNTNVNIALMFTQEMARTADTVRLVQQNAALLDAPVEQIIDVKEGTND